MVGVDEAGGDVADRCDDWAPADPDEVSSKRLTLRFGPDAVGGELISA
jgi:hypothetical protein